MSDRLLHGRRYFAISGLSAAAPRRGDREAYFGRKASTKHRRPDGSRPAIGVCSPLPTQVF
jgi:hypothetical protein